MAATYYAQLLRAYRWDIIVAALDEAIRRLRLTYEEDPALIPTDGVDASVDGVTANAYLDPDDGDILAQVYLGRTYRDSPSGSFYAPWSAVPDSVRDRDARWYDAFERVANKHGLGITVGEGDPTDTYANKIAPLDDPVDLALMPDDIGAK